MAVRMVHADLKLVMFPMVLAVRETTWKLVTMAFGLWHQHHALMVVMKAYADLLNVRNRRCLSARAITWSPAVMVPGKSYNVPMVVMRDNADYPNAKLPMHHVAEAIM